jgi:hypothetical protein
VLLGAPLDQESPGSSPGGATESAASDLPVAALSLFEAVRTTTLPGNVVAAAHDAAAGGSQHAARRLGEIGVGPELGPAHGLLL